MDEDKVKRAIRRAYGGVAEEVQAESLEHAVEMALDADRPRFMGGLSREEWTEFLALPPGEQDRIGAEALRGQW